MVFRYYFWFLDNISVTLDILFYPLLAANVLGWHSWPPTVVRFYQDLAKILVRVSCIYLTGIKGCSCIILLQNRSWQIKSLIGPTMIVGKNPNVYAYLMDLVFFWEKNICIESFKYCSSKTFESSIDYRWKTLFKNKSYKTTAITWES